MARTRRTDAFTRRDLLAVIVAVVVVVILLLTPAPQARQKAERIWCVNNLKCIGTAYRIWGNGNGDHFPAFTPQTNGGWSNLLYLTNASAYAWTNYAIMANELGQSVRVLVCASDERKPAISYSNLANTNISYFVGVNANDVYPQSILGGDRNLGPGTTPDAEYGFSPADGRGNDVIINGPVCWSLKMHSRGNNAGAGNILLGDGSAQQVTSGSFSQNWLKNAFAEKVTWVTSSNSPNTRDAVEVSHKEETNSPLQRLIFP